MDQPVFRILILGSGAREHALVLKLSKEPTVNKVCVAPGNPGIKGRKVLSTLHTVVMNPENDYKKLVLWAQDMNINLVIPGDQKYIVHGLIDRFINRKLDFIDPSW